MSLNESHKKYYELESFWENDLNQNPEDNERVTEIINSIPEDCNSILEVGCGNGAIVNRLQEQAEGRRIVGIDISETALKYVKSEKYIGNINSIPFDDNSFDCVIVSEVIEHLTVSDFQVGLRELQRVAKRFILISVPNADDLQMDLRMCKNCHCWFNPDYHMNSFTKESLKNILNDFDADFVKEIGPIKSSFIHTNISRCLLHYYKTPTTNIGICPQCGYEFKKTDDIVTYRPNNILFKKIKTVLDIFIKTLILKKEEKSRWLLARFKKETSINESY